MKLGLISDAHGNVFAFDKAVDVLRKSGADQLLFLGDAVGYLPGTGVVDRVIERGVPSLLGNHEAMLLENNYPSEREPIYRLAEIRESLTSTQRNHIEGLPESSHRGNALFVHGSPDDYVFGYVYPDTPLEKLSQTQEKFVFMGNTHRPFIGSFGGVTYVNVGSCAMPRDQSGLGSVALFDDESLDVKIIRFDISREVNQAIEGLDLHESVRGILYRKAEDRPFGEYYEPS